MELLLPVALWRATRPPWAWTFALCSAVMYVSVIASLSRAGSFLVSLEVLAVPVSVLLVRPTAVRRDTLRRVVVAAALIVVLTSAFGWKQLLKRFDSGDLWQIRREYFRSSVTMLRSRPLMGFGLGTWPIVYPRFAVTDLTTASPHAHNDWMEWASDGGIPFVLFMLIPIVRLSKEALRHPWGMGVITVSLHALVDFPFQVYSIMLTFFLLAAALESSRTISEISSESSNDDSGQLVVESVHGQEKTQGWAL
jgi:O-antigen ligase